ncbi:MAG: DUF4180 domain-containing protein [Deltaproteobacteria bacterium]
MTIKYAILGLLSWQPLAGYDLKKIFSEQTIFYWSGNNNQIYKTLVQLLEEALVSKEVQEQEHLPAKKVYSITEKGRGELRGWIMSEPEYPETRKPFLIKLALADQLEPIELDTLLASYENTVEMQMLMEKEKIRRGSHLPGRTPREAYLRDAINENIIMYCESELTWVRRLRRGVKQQGSHFTGGISMKCRTIETNGVKYVEGPYNALLIKTDTDAVDLLSFCGENDTNRLLLWASNLHEDFFDLKTGLAGAVLQKFVNYGIKAAAVIPAELVNQGRFREMALEANRGQHFRIFTEAGDAEAWLIEN